MHVPRHAACKTRRHLMPGTRLETEGLCLSDVDTNAGFPLRPEDGGDVEELHDAHALDIGDRKRLHCWRFFHSPIAGRFGSSPSGKIGRRRSARSLLNGS